jgi:TetR/AcrR family transcriptional regulator, regulator of cefoperazone and chloramphenicol sensitivity
MRAMPERNSQGSRAALGPDEPQTQEPDARTRLLMQAARLFAEQGFTAVTTREICAAAACNPGAIHYHFGDKDGLYREVLLHPIREMSARFAGFDHPELGLEQALHRFLTPFLLMPEKELGFDPMRLFLREQLDPSAVFTQTVAEHIGPHHHALARLLARHIGVQQPDSAIHQLAYALVAMAHDYCLSRPFMDALTPGLLADDPKLELLHQRLVAWGAALVAAERTRRQTPSNPHST